MVEEHTHRRSCSSPPCLLAIDVVKGVVHEEANPGENAVPAIDSSFKFIVIDHQREKVRQKDEGEACQCDEIRSEPQWNTLLKDRITHWALDVCVVEAVALALVLPFEDILLMLRLDVGSSTFEQVSELSGARWIVAFFDLICHLR